MRNTWLIAMRELKERFSNSTFLWMMFIGPLFFLIFLFFLFKSGDEGKTTLKVLIVDPAGLMENKIVTQEGKAVQYYFISDYLEIEEFRDGKRYQDFDALVEANEKVLMNKKVFVFYRENPSMDVKMQLKFQLERRVEEVMIENFTNLSVDQFRQIKQPLNVDFRNVYDPKDESSHLEGWVGLVFGTLIVLFVLLFGMTILRSTTKEKSNRIVEVLLASVKPTQLMLGKITGIGLAAVLQIFVWTFFIGIGLIVFRQFIFPDMFDPSNWEGVQVTAEVQQQVLEATSAQRYNQFVDLIYGRINFGFMFVHFLFFFVAAYYFFGAFFSAIGAMSGTESDGQQFILPVIGILGLSIYSGYMTVVLPDSTFVKWAEFIPFTSPVVVMVKLAQSYVEGTHYHVVLSLLSLLISTYLFLWMAGRIYKNGILQFGHRARLKNLFQWIKS
ncbi:MAG: ABC transporter permease [Crocinitomicaceae bacterium]|nr:ABC transporter permease [Crocinitomicaceae bacterium]